MAINDRLIGSAGTVNQIPIRPKEKGRRKHGNKGQHGDDSERQVIARAILRTNTRHDCENDMFQI